MLKTLRRFITNVRFFPLLLILIFSVSVKSQTCVNFDGNSIYYQNFNGLGQSPSPQNSDSANILNIATVSTTASRRFLGKFDNALSDANTSVNIPGWAIVEEGTNTSSVTGRYNVGDGSANGGNTYSFGTLLSADRALGSLNDATVATNYLGGCFTYTGTTQVLSVQMSYVGEIWRYGSGTDALFFEYAVNATNLFQGTYVSAPAFNFSTPATAAGIIGARDGNLEANQTLFPFAPLNVTLNPGDRLYVRWRDNNVGTNDGLAIDDFLLGVLPLSANARIEGRVVTPENRGIPNTFVKVVSSNGTTRTAITNPFGYFILDEILTGETYVLTVSSKRYSFENPTRILTLNDDAAEIIFTSAP